MKAGWLAFVCLIVVADTNAEVRFRNLEDPDAPQWVEDAVELPRYPEEKNLREFYVNEMTAHRFFIDEASFSIGKDGVVRYTLVVRTRGGSTNTTYEGIHCERRELKLYATGRQDGVWTATRKGEWRIIENKPINRHHATLYRDYLCPSGTTIVNPEEGREALRRAGKQPDSILMR